MAKVIQLRPQTPKTLSESQALQQHVFELTNMRRDLTKMAKHLKLMEGKLRLRLLNNAELRGETTS